MAGKDTKIQEEGGTTMTFTVAECGEFHSLGKFHEGIKTPEEAAAIYRGIPDERRSGIPSIGINLHAEGTEKWMDTQIDVVTGEGIDMAMVRLVPEMDRDPRVHEAVEALARLFPEKEVLEL